MSQNPASAVGAPFSETRQKNPALAIIKSERNL